MTKRQLIFISLASLFIAGPLGLIGYKLLVLDYRMADLIPATSYHVDIAMTVDGHGDNIDMSTYLPKSDARQRITEEAQTSGDFTLDIGSTNLNRIASWQAEAVKGHQSVRYSFAVQAQHVQYKIPPNLQIPKNYPESLAPYLRSEEGVPLENPLIDEAIHKILPQGNVTVLEALEGIHRYLQDNLKNRNFSGYTDAITAYKLGEASCNGKGRLFVALARKINLPARLVGGLIMHSGSKRVSHQWVEIYVNGYWVPFDTINDHFAEIPANFLTLYYGDKALFQHSTNINFQYAFQISKKLVPKSSLREHIGDSPFNIANLYLLFESIGISQNLLKIILMIPLGALVTVIFRNVIGLETFGTFLPALIAAAARDTGLLWGLIGFVMVIVLTALIRRALDWMELLHSPKMAILLTAVVMIILGTTVLSVKLSLLDLAHLSLFPIAILAITAERFTIYESEQGLKKAARVTAATMVVIAAAYAVMDSQFLQSMILAFPELLLVLIGLNMWLGKWIGMRVTEFFRFRKLILSESSK
ncbi:MAG TPA: UUP1 family membrane protein [Mariprofundaceae bacterium]|nr:UUP1 family membrane protein [Mariprofundaceae bacterium]